MPLLSIVTIVRNHRAGLEKTIAGVRTQTFKDYEYIVADGASTDGTLDVIESNRELFSKVLYGPDGGIYDAMNKGIAAAEGKYIIFMNAGDIFASDDALSRLFASDGGEDVVYGDYIVDYGYARKYVKAKDVKDFWKGMITSHQAFAVNAMMMKKNPFNVSVPLGADFEMIYGFFINGASFRYVPAAVSVMEPGGLSDVRRITVYSNHLDTIKKYGAGIGKRAYYAYLFADTWLRQTVKMLMPKKLVEKIIKAGTGR